MKLDASTTEILLFLRSTPMLEGLKEQSLMVLANAARFVPVAKGSYLFHQYDPAHSVFILQLGEIAIVLTSFDGREMIVNEVHSGELIGEVSLLTTVEGRTAGALAREDSRLLEIGALAFMSVLDKEPMLARRMLQVATQRLYKAHQRESALAFLDAQGRIARMILEMDEADRLGPDKGYITLSQEELARRTGLTRQTVANCLGKWRRKNWIFTGRGRIMLLNREALRRIEEQDMVADK
jgi:CRP-like cAMP-binding protein